MSKVIQGFRQKTAWRNVGALRGIRSRRTLYWRAMNSCTFERKMR